MFFTAYLLGLETREAPDLGLDAAQLGSILHEALEAAYREAEHPPDAESVLRALDRELEPILDRAPDVYGFRPTPLWVIERQQYAEALRDTVTALAEQGDDWTPIGLELRFGGNGEAPLTLDLPGRTVRLRGIIDRLDRREGGELRVIDYKTGSGRLNVRELEQGRRIQLPLYALAAQEALGLGQVVEGFYWAILAAKRSTLRLSNYREPGENGEAGPPVAYDTTRGHVARIVNGVSAGQYPPEPPPGGCPRYCPAAAWCWRYQPTGWG
jgi:RecB family exonuclease